MLPRLRKLLLWSLGVALGLVVLLTALVLIGERLIDTPKVRAQLTEKLSRLLNGKVAWQQLTIRLLPLPHGEVRGVHVAIPNLVTVDVATADVRMRLLPLLRGNAEVQAITLERPEVAVWIAASAAGARAQEKPPQPINPLARYRSAMRPLLDAAARFAPDTTVVIRDGRAALQLFDMPAFEASKLSVRIVTDARGIALDAAASGTLWDRVAIAGRVEFADLRARLTLEGSGLRAQPLLEELFTELRQSVVLSNVAAKVEARTDGHTGIDVALGLDLPKAALQRHGKQLDIVRVRVAGSGKFTAQDIAIELDEVHLGELAPAAHATLVLTGAQHAPQLEVAIDELDLARLRDAVLTLAGDRPAIQEYVARIHGGRLRDLRFSTQAERFAGLFALPRLHASAQLADASMLVPKLEREATAITARAELVSGALQVRDVSARVGASRLRQAGADIVFLKPMRLERTRGQASIVLHDLLPGLRSREPFARWLRSVPALTGVAEARVRSLALRFAAPRQLAYDISVSPQQVRVKTAKLPEALALHEGTVRITPQAINVEHVGVGVLDSRASVSGELTDFQGGHLRVAARIADGVAGRQLIDWIWRRASLAARLKPATPLRFSAQRVQWSDAGLDVVADASINAGPALSAELSTRDNTFTLRRATIKDRDSDATISFAMRDSLVEVGFAGVLALRSLAPIFGRPAADYAGSARGDMQAKLDFRRQGRSTARGDLAGERIGLQNLTGTPLKLERFDLQGNGNALNVRELTLDWAAQRATIRGAVAREANELAATLEIDSPGIVIDALRGTSAASPGSAPADTASKASQSFDLWSLPLTGSASLRTDFVEYRGHRVEGVRAVATLGHDTAAIDLTEASLCGVAFPLSLRVTPKEFDAKASVTAKNQSLEGVVQCLAGKRVVITGNFNVTSVLTATGPTEHIGESLAGELAGSVEFSAQEGEIRKMALLGNILSLKSVSKLYEGDVDLGSQGFRYRSIVASARIDKGEMTLEQAALDSAALGLAGTGTINLSTYDSRLTVLVAPFGTLDRVVRKTPVLGYVIGGAFTSVPVSVTGDIRAPTVVPLGPRAVGSEVLGVFERTFKLPGKMVEPLGTKPGE